MTDLDTLANGLLSGGATVGGGAIILAIIYSAAKIWPTLSQINTDGDAVRRSELWTRIEKLEAQIATMQADRAAENEKHDAEMRLLRHRLNSETQTLDALLMLIQAAPEKLVENLPRILRQREQQRGAVNGEREAMLSERIKGRDDE